MNADAATGRGPSALDILARAGVLAVLAAGLGVAVVFAAVAAAVLGLIVLGAALALQFAPRETAPEGAHEASLEARRTPSGWVVETGPARRA